jgi:hypothetical protein
MHGAVLRKRAEAYHLPASHSHEGLYALGMLNAHGDSARCQKGSRVNVLACENQMCPLMPVKILTFSQNSTDMEECHLHVPTHPRVLSRSCRLSVLGKNPGYRYLDCSQQITQSQGHNGEMCGLKGDCKHSFQARHRIASVAAPLYSRASLRSANQTSICGRDHARNTMVVSCSQHPTRKERKYSMECYPDGRICQHEPLDSIGTRLSLQKHFQHRTTRSIGGIRSFGRLVKSNVTIHHYTD